MPKRKWIKVAPGVRYREHPERRWSGRPDRYWTVYFRKDGKLIEQGLGWSSERWNQTKAQGILLELKTNAKMAKGPATLKEKRELQREQVEKTQRQKEHEEKTNLPFGQMVDLYLTWARANKTSWPADESRAKTHLKPVLGGMPAKQIDINVLNEFKQGLIDRGLSSSTVKHCLVLIRQIFNYLISTGRYIGTNPAASANIPKTFRRRLIPGKLDNQRLRFLSKEEADKLLKGLANRSMNTHDIALISLRTGARFDEVVSLRWQDVDMFNNVIHLRGKGGKTRQAFMTPDIKESLFQRGVGRADELVFPSRTGGKIRQLSGAFMRAVEDLGFNKHITDPRQRVVFHTLRHTFASWLALRGTPLQYIQELMGHERYEMTQRYSHLLPDRKREAVMGMFSEMTSDRVRHLKNQE
jgi:integrase